MTVKPKTKNVLSLTGGTSKFIYDSLKAKHAQGCRYNFTCICFFQKLQKVLQLICSRSWQNLPAIIKRQKRWLDRLNVFFVFGILRWMEYGIIKFGIGYCNIRLIIFNSFFFKLYILLLVVVVALFCVTMLQRDYWDGIIGNETF